MALSITIAFAKQAEKVLFGGRETGACMRWLLFLGTYEYIKKQLSHGHVRPRLDLGDALGNHKGSISRPYLTIVIISTKSQNDTFCKF
jgi:hypothetical protein